MQPTIHTRRLILRPFADTDARAVQRLAGDSLIADTTTTIPHPYPDGAAEAWIAKHAQQYADRSTAIFAVVERSSAVLIGTVSLTDISAEHKRAELGYWLGIQYWSNGFCTEAVSALIEHGSSEFAITRFFARCFARNPASVRVLERCGLQREGLLVKHIAKSGSFEDVLLYGLVLPARTDQRSASLGKQLEQSAPR